MYLKVYLSLALFVAMPSWSQVPISDPAAVPGTGGKMLTPPPVSGQAYPTEVGSEVRSNYLRAGFTFTPSYSNDVVGEANVPPVSDFVYSFFPTLTVDKTTSREHLTLTYSPSFTIYQRTSSENQTNQNLSLSFQYRLSPHVTVSLRATCKRSRMCSTNPVCFPVARCLVCPNLRSMLLSARWRTSSGIPQMQK